MANNYYEATGVLVLDRVTPVIQALFGAFALAAVSLLDDVRGLPVRVRFHGMGLTGVSGYGH